MDDVFEKSTAKPKQQPRDSGSNEQSAEWKEYFFNRAAKIINPPDARLEAIKQKNEQVNFYVFKIGLIDGVSRRIDSEAPNPLVYVQLSFFDVVYKKFFGHTWIGPGKKPARENEDLQYDENVYFCTTITDDHVLIVVEVVSQNKSGKYQGYGWSAFKPFAPSNEIYQRICLYHGTPRALLFMDDPFEKNPQLSQIAGSYINFSIGAKSKLSAIKKFFPENVFIGRFDKLGGVFHDSTRNYLEKPRLVSQLSVIIDDLYIYLNPNVAKFESEFMQLVADDKSLWNRVKIEPSTITISERRIKIGVHNGWRFVHEPHIVHLSIDDPSIKQYSQFASSKRLSLKSSLRAKAAETDMLPNSTANRLIMRNSVILNEVFEDAMCAIVFLLEYVINVPIQFGLDGLNDNPRNKNAVGDATIKKQLETHHILIRWGAYFPYLDNLNNQMEDSRMEINMFGTGFEAINPEGKLVYRRPDTNMQDNFSSKSAPGKITFDIRKGNHVNFKQRSDDNQEQLDMQQSARSYEHDTGRRLNETQSKSVNDLYNSMMAKSDEHLQTPLANLLMSQIITQQKLNDSQRMVGLFAGNLELYPIYNPSLHMPVLALAPGQIGGRTMSRAAYAKLQSANFPAIQDRFGKPADVIDGNSFLQFSMNEEENDMLACNQVIFQFLAYSVNVEALREGKSEGKPRGVFFTFQFYRFPEFKTPSLKLDKVIPNYSTDTTSTPFLLKNVERQTSSHDSKDHETPGYMVSYSVDPTNLKFGEKRMFLQYLAYQTMFIDVWDGESLHLIGTATMQMKDLLRHGKEAVQSTFELDVMKTEYDDHNRLNSNETQREGVPYSSDSHIRFQGLLHIRIGNVGTPVHDPSDPINQTSLAPSMPFTRVIASKNSLHPFGEDLLARKIDEQTHQGMISHYFSKAHHMTEVFKDIHTALMAQHNQNSGTGNEDMDALKKRKLRRMQLVRRQEEKDYVPPLNVGYHRRVIEERNKDLRTMEFYRNQTKHDQIMNKLHEFITTEYAIYPNYGVVEFFEFVLTNPFNEPQAITIIIDDPEIQVVTDAKEWRHLKILHQIYSQVEDNMFDKKEINPAKTEIKYPQIYLRPKETINIPFKFQTFRADNRVENDNSYLKQLSEDGVIRSTPAKYEIRKANVYFRAEDKNPVSILRLVIDQQPHVVTQTFRFYECEHAFLKKNIRIPSSVRVLAATSTALLSGNIELDGTVTDAATTQLFVRCSDANIVCESRPVTVGEPHDILIKAPTGASPSVRKFYVAIYADQYLAVPLQIWQIYVHALHRIDVSSILGQASRFSLILKGTQSSRVVKCFSNYPDEMTIIPEDKFMLPASSVQEINVGLQTLKSGLKHYYLNVVDTETSQLVHSWFVNVNSKPPVVSKGFELTLPVSMAGSTARFPSQKRISYMNPYSTNRVFLLSTNRDDLITFKERRIMFLANEQKTIGLRFLPNAIPGFVEVYVFVNNENNNNEETFGLRIHYVKKYSEKI